MYTQNSKNLTQLSNIFYKLCEKLGSFWGNITSIIINYLSDYILIGINGINITNTKFIETMIPVYNDCKGKFKNKFTDSSSEEFNKRINNLI